MSELLKLLDFLVYLGLVVFFSLATLGMIGALYFCTLTVVELVKCWCKYRESADDK